MTTSDQQTSHGTQPQIGDAFGAALLAHHRGDDGTHVVERDDGHRHEGDAARYFGGLDAWSPAEAAAGELMTGRVLDVGTGAGRVAIEAARRGLDVLAIDTSPGAIEVSRHRGVPRAKVATIDELGDETWDTITLFGSNLGLMGSRDEAPRFLSVLRGLAARGAVMLGSSRDPLLTDDEAHLRYHRRNIERGHMPGQVRIRVAYRDLVTHWFDYLYLSPDELRALIEGSGWALDDVFGEKDRLWVAVLRAV
jgi:SAM-dependent methyltransferase